MVNDPISDMLIRIQNGYRSQKSEVSLPWTKILESLGQVLVKHGYLASLKTSDQDGRKSLNLTLHYEDKTPSLTGVRRVSRPSLRVYVKSHSLPIVFNGLGLAVISTPAGLMTADQARKKGLGGEVLCEVW